MGPRHERIGPLPGGVDRPAIAAYPAGAVLDDRTLDVHELVWMLRGSATVLTDAGVRRGGALPASDTLPPSDTLLPGDVLLVPPGSVHAFRWGTASSGCSHGYVHVQLEHGAPPGGCLVVGRSGNRDPLGGLCAYLEWLGVREPPGWRGWAARAAGLAADLVLEGPLPAAAPRPPRRPPVLEALVAELRARWGAGPPLAPLRVDDLADAVHASPRHVGRCARQAWGRPLSTLLEHLRLTRVELLLTGTSATLAAIARACGYADAFHCSRRFSAAHGMPPGRYRLAARAPSLLDDPVIRDLADEVWGVALPDDLG